MHTDSIELVSIIITTHRGSDTVERAVKSVLQQDYPNLEIIVVDDNGFGTNEQTVTEKVLSSYIKEKSILYHPHKTNMNGSAARNTGIALAHGRYIGLLDDDDIYLPGKITESVQTLRNLSEDWGGVYTDTEVDYGDGRKYVNKYHCQGNIVFELLAHTIFVNPSVIIMRKAAIDRIGGFDESFRRHQDWEFNARLSDQFKIAHISMVGSVYNCEVKRHSDPTAAKAYRSYYIEKMKPIISKLPRFKQEVIYYRNAIDICGARFGNLKECKELISAWGERVGRIAFYYTLYLTAKERLNVRHNRIKGTEINGKKP